MEDQVLDVDKEQGALAGAGLARKLLKKERRLSERLEEVQEAEARAQDRFQRAQVRLERRKARLERIKGKLILVQRQIADSHIPDQKRAQEEPALVMPTTAEATSEEVAPVQAEQDMVVAQGSEVSSPSPVETTSSNTVESEVVIASVDTSNTSAVLEAEVLSSPQTEAVPLSADFNQVIADSNGEIGENERKQLALQQEISSPELLQAAPGEATPEPEGSSSSIESTAPTAIEQEVGASSDSATGDVPGVVEQEVGVTPEDDTSSDSSMEREPTKPLRLEQGDQSAAGSLSADVQAAKEAWVAAESAMQHARNIAHGIAASISFLSQTSEFSEKFMAELVYKQAEANKALVKAQDAAGAAYERFVQAQENAEHAASQPVDVSAAAPEDHSRQKQENGALPVAEEDNGTDQTVSMHAIRLYKM